MTRLPKSGLCAIALLCLTFLGGCAMRQPPLYHWGSYQAQVYGHFRGEKSPEEQIQALEKDKEIASAEGQVLPPGFQAHLAMLYGTTGQSDRLVENLEAEKAHYPESSTFMDFLLNKLNP